LSETARPKILKNSILNQQRSACREGARGVRYKDLFGVAVQKMGHSHSEFDGAGRQGSGLGLPRRRLGILRRPSSQRRFTSLS
jgi:hypothetical protein